MERDEQTTPLWPATVLIPYRPPLAENLIADVCVVGAGIAGLSVAYQLAAWGRRVVVVDAGQVGGGETGRTTGHLTTVPDDSCVRVERIHGAAGARLAAASHARAIDEIERIVSRERIDCGFERLDGYLFPAPAEPAGKLEAEFGAALRSGIEGVERVSRAPLESFDTGPAIRFPRQAQFHPLRYLAGLAEAVERLGGRIYGESRAVGVEGGSTALVRLRSGHTVTAAAAVVAADTPFNDRLAVHTKQASYRTYAIAAQVHAGAVPRGLYWDTDEPFHYARLQTLADATEVLIVGGEDHKTGQDDDSAWRFSRLEEWARVRFPSMGRVARRWSGQILTSADGLAFIGRNPGDADNVFIVTGDCGRGLTHGTIAGLLLPSLIAGEEHRWAALYEPGRIHARSFGKWAGENLNAAAQYADLLKPGEISSPDQLAPGTGALMRRGLAQVAVYRAPDGTIKEFSARCPHLGGTVCWNSAEKTWDCPAHGSRFDTDGCVLNGPAASDLKPAKGEAPVRRA
ncbi:MAG: FAD-dependent oxidoreductase [Elusimicrobia bacterium]|nr:FAD-dependent oxidoreductase [Elusimicrobiota bacterium]